MSADEQVRDAIDELYRAFAAPAPVRINACPCCLAPHEVATLLSRPLCDLTGKELWGYVSNAFATVGEERDFRYFLPRLLEISINDPGNAEIPEIVLGKLASANWTSWQASEREAIEAFVAAWFESALVSDLTGAEHGWGGRVAEAILCGMERAGMALDGVLDRLTEPEATPSLDNLRDHFPERLSSFWNRESDGFRRLSAILAAQR